MKNIGAPIDVIVTDTDSYEKNRLNPYMIYMEADLHGKVVYEKLNTDTPVIMSR